MLREYEEVLGVTAAKLDSLRSKLPSGGVAVVLLDGTPEALKVCASLVEHKGPIGSDMSETTGAGHLEWHMAVLSGGRLAVCAHTPVGAFRFAATLRQMLDEGLQEQTERDSSKSDVRVRPLWSLPSFHLEDWPQYGWRGLQLDCVRHFMPVDFIKRYLRAMAYYKANMFHWHLTDDQAWRLFIKSRPKLVSSNQWSPGFYTAEEVREVVSFAASLFINVVPTIETPGHALAALAAYPALACEGTHFEVPKTRVGTYSEIICAPKKEAERFARDVFAEVAELFPGKYVHVGGDEVPTVAWEQSEHVMAFAGMAGLNNLGTDVMEAWFCFLGNLLAQHGKTMVVWDDHFALRDRFLTRKCPGAEQNWVVQAWKLEFPVGDLEQKAVLPTFPFRTIASPMKFAYLDYPVASIDFNTTLQWQLGGTADTMLGGCANMWTEDSEPKDVGAKVFPRYLGLAERLWGGPAAPKGSLMGLAMLRDPSRPGRGDEARRTLDEPTYVAAQRHCGLGGPIHSQLGFSCGKFQPMVNARSKTWAGATWQTLMDQYTPAYSGEGALDGDEDSYFWAIAPKRGDYFEVSWMDSSHPVERVGKWFNKVAAVTGATDRPGDRLDVGELWASQWLKNASSGLYEARWVQLANFSDGRAVAAGPEVARGPIVAVRVVCMASQTKWMALREITAEEGPAQPHPFLGDLPLSALTAKRSETLEGRQFPWLTL